MGLHMAMFVKQKEFIAGYMKQMTSGSLQVEINYEVSEESA